MSATLLEGALTEQLAARIERVRAGGDHDALVAWVAEVARAYGDVAGIRTIVDAAAADLGMLGDALRDAARMGARPIVRSRTSRSTSSMRASTR